MQANGRFVQHVTHALQIATQLRGEPNALRLAATQRGRAPVQREVTQADLFQKFQAAPDLWNQITRDVSLALAQCAAALQRLYPDTYIGHAQGCDVRDTHAVKAHRTRGRVQARSVAAWAGGVGQVFNIRLGKGLLTALVVVVFD